VVAVRAIAAPAASAARDGVTNASRITERLLGHDAYGVS
jgi:hypothetical protein